jgi:hypothetical protein
VPGAPLEAGRVGLRELIVLSAASKTLRASLAADAVWKPHLARIDCRFYPDPDEGAGVFGDGSQRKKDQQRGVVFIATERRAPLHHGGHPTPLEPAPSTPRHCELPEGQPAWWIESRFVERAAGGGNAVLVRLTGLEKAAHLNGREGVVRGRDPSNPERFTVRMLKDDKEVNVRPVNFETVQRADGLFRGGGLCKLNAVDP